jgi:hypothetical protein
MPAKAGRISGHPARKGSAPRGERKPGGCVRSGRRAIKKCDVVRENNSASPSLIAAGDLSVRCAWHSFVLNLRRSDLHIQKGWCESFHLACVGSHGLQDAETVPGLERAPSESHYLAG